MVEKGRGSWRDCAIKTCAVSLCCVLCIAVLSLAIPGAVFAEEQQERPKSLSLEDLAATQVDRRVLEAVDREKLLAEDLERDKLEQPGPHRFAIGEDVDFDLKNSGTWFDLAEGRLWLLSIHSPGAVSHNLAFSQFDLPRGAMLWLRDPSGEHVSGPYTSEHRDEEGGLWTPVIQGDEIVIELFVPETLDDASGLGVRVGKVNKGYRGFGHSHGACNNDVVCPEGGPWQKQIRSVVLYTIGGGGSCTGSLINNTAVDGRPYILSAHHCGVNAGNDHTLNFYWNWEAVNCGDQDAPLTTFIQIGATFRASWVTSDFLLFELNAAPASPNPYWTGWDRQGIAPAATVGIHHPSTHVKSISLNNNPVTSTNYGSTAVNAGANYWRVDDWEDGTTEPGSSGSCLWDAATRLCIGQLRGGSASCALLNEDDWYGKFSASWGGGGTDATRLSNWLDPVPTGATTLNGDPHITTLDGTHYDFQGAGEYVMLRDASGAEVQARQAPIATTFNPGPNPYHGLATCVSLNSAVAARVGGRRVTYQPNLSGVPDPSGLQLRVDGVLKTLGSDGIDLGGGGRIEPTSAQGGLKIHFPERYVLTVTPGWWASQSKWYLNIHLAVTGAAQSLEGGSLGGASAAGGLGGPIVTGSWLPALPDGSSMGPMPATLHDRYVDLYEKFGEAWRVTGATSLFDYAVGDSTDTFTLKSWPMENPPCELPRAKPVKPADVEVAQEACAGVKDDQTRADCVFDVRVTGELGFAETYLATERVLGRVDGRVERGYALSVHLGYPLPLSDFDDVGADGKGAVALDLEWRFAPRRSLEFVLGRYAFEIDPVALDVDIDGLSAYYKRYSDVVGSPRWFWQLGAGIFDVQPGQSTQGISGGIGWQKPIGTRVEFEAAGLLFHLFSTGGQDDIDFALAQVGLKLAY